MRRRPASLCAVMALVLCVCCSCSDSSGYRDPPPEAPAPRVLTPEEELGIEPPGVLDAAVAAWAKKNELGDYYEQSQRRLEKARGKLLDDYRVRKGMAEPPTTFTKEWLAKYREEKMQDDALRRHILECYSRGVVRPLPEGLLGVFSGPGERRLQAAKLADSAPSSLDAMEETHREIASALDAIGFLSWETEKDLPEWQSLAARLGGLSGRAQRLAADAEGLSSRIADLAAGVPEDGNLSGLERRASSVRRDTESLSLRVSGMLGIAEGQMALAAFAEECRRVEGWMRTLDGRTAAKGSRIGQERAWRGRVVQARKTGNRAEIAAAASALGGFRTAMARDKADGDAAQKDIESFKRCIDDSSFRKFKRVELPEKARAGADVLRAGVLRAIPEGRKPAGFFDVLETKAFELRDDYEEKAALAELEAAINR